MAKIKAQEALTALNTILEEYEKSFEGMRGEKFSTKDFDVFVGGFVAALTLTDVDNYTREEYQELAEFIKNVEKIPFAVKIGVTGTAIETFSWVKTKE